MRELLELWNPWWADGAVPPSWRGVPRARYLDPLLSEAGRRHVSVVTGPRRTGKTTLLFQVVQALIEKGTVPGRILYAALDSPALPQDEPVGQLLREFRKLNRLGRRDRTYIFLDEAQYIKDWARWAKAIHDSENAKLYVFGSTGGIMVDDSHASLVGRWRKTVVHPLDYREFLGFKGYEAGPAEQYLHERYLEEYARTGGFPEVACSPDPSERHQILTHYFEDFVLKDAPRFRSVRDPGTLVQLAALMARKVGTAASLNKLARVLKMSTVAAASYMDALCGVLLYSPCEFYSRSATERAYNPKKYYPADTGLAAAVTGKFQLGTAMENLVFNHLSKSSRTFYWKSVQEADFYQPAGRLAVEVKYGPGGDGRELRGLLALAAKEKLKKVFVATASGESEETEGGVTVVRIPVWKILLDWPV